MVAPEETLYIESVQRKREGPCLLTRRVRQLCGPLRLGRRRGPRKSNFLIAPFWPVRAGVYEITPSPHSIMSGIRAQPLSIESLLQKQKEEKEAASKVCPVCGNHLSRDTHVYYVSQPRFLTKEQRAQLAIEKRAQEIKEQRERERKQQQDREELEKEAEEVRHRERERDRASRYSNSSGANSGGRRECHPVRS